jgi:hypothetical protein
MKTNFYSLKKNFICSIMAMFPLWTIHAQTEPTALGKVETDKRRDSHCGQGRRNVKGLIQEIETDISKDTKGTISI